MISALILLAQTPMTIERDLALQGKDPISLLEGRAVAGFPSFSATYGAFIYQFESQENLRKFKSNPERYGLQIGGACGNMGPLSGRGRGQFYTVWNNRIWQFASPQCRDTFLKNPQLFDDQPIAANKIDKELVSKGRQLLDKVATAHGGDRAISNIHRLVWTQTVEGARKEDGYTKTYGVDLKLGTMYGEAGEGWGYKSVANSKHALQFSDKFVMPLVESEKRYLHNLVGKHVLLLLRDRKQPGFYAQSLGMPSKTGELEVVINYRQDRTTLVLDSKTYRVIRAWTNSRLFGKNLPVIIEYPKWIRSSGVLVPSTTIIRPYGGDKNLSVTWNQPRINDPKDAGLFTIPEQVKNAR